MNCFSLMTSDQCVPATQGEFDELKRILDENLDTDDPCGIDCEFDGCSLYLYGAEMAQPDLLPPAALELLGALLRRARLPYLEFGCAYLGSRLREGSCGGRYFRLLPTGEIVTASISWPRRPWSRKPKPACVERGIRTRPWRRRSRHKASEGTLSDPM